VHPAGLSKRWDESFPRESAEDFTLKVMEANPTFSYKFCDKFAMGAGLRLLYADGEVRSYRNIGLGARRDLEGDTTEFGYNLAATLRPTTQWTVSATYRSKVDLDLEGDARLHALDGSTYNGYAAVSVPVPAVLTVATAYTFDRTTVEFAYDKTFWNAYDKLDFNYSYALAGWLAPFDTPVAKNWVNTEAFRIGVTHRCTERLTAMAGFAMDRTPVPDYTLGFELPDADALIYSLGARYRYSDQLDFGLAYLYDHKASRTIPAAAGNLSGINGTFDDGGAHLLSVAAQYKF
ncbi:MAG: outer membrane protein transport protein, partial [Desulfobulbaceae bacterium]|nr:outer membrane protein transport protein [Desulfobulbaceae bacterium]